MKTERSQARKLANEIAKFTGTQPMTIIAQGYGYVEMGLCADIICALEYILDMVQDGAI